VVDTTGYSFGRVRHTRATEPAYFPADRDPGGRKGAHLA
jgi:hypothetical protein